MPDLTSSSFTVSVCQATVFTAELAGTMGGLVRAMLPRWLARFDGEPAFSADDAGHLRISLQTVDRVWRADVTDGRLDLYQVLVGAKAEVPAPQAFFPAAATWLLETGPAMRIVRLAAVVTRVAPHEAPGAYLSQRYCQPRWTIDPPAMFEVAWHARHPLGAELRATNSWIRIRTAPGPDPAIMRVVHVEQDLNTLLEDAATVRFTAGDVARWFARVPAVFADTLAQHFPSP